MTVNDLRFMEKRKTTIGGFIPEKYSEKVE